MKSRSDISNGVIKWRGPWDLPRGRTVSKRTIWRPALTIQSFIRICGRPLVWFAMANEFCRLGQLDISYSQGSATRISPDALVFLAVLVQTVLHSCAHYTISFYLCVCVYIYARVYRVSHLRAAVTVSNVARELFAANCLTDPDHRVARRTSRTACCPLILATIHQQRHCPTFPS